MPLDRLVMTSIGEARVELGPEIVPSPDPARARFADHGRARLAVLHAKAVPEHRTTCGWPGSEVGITESGHELYLARDPDGSCPSAIELDLATSRAYLYVASGPAVFGAPLDRFLFARLLADDGRAIVHAAGFVAEGAGVLCGAESGGGKTTLSRAAAEAGLTVLSDERVVIGLDDRDEPTLWGTPWYGEGGFAEPGPAPLARILFLEKSDTNLLRPLTAASAAARVLALSTLPYWNREATARAVTGVARLLERVPAAVLGTRGDRSSIDFLADLLRT